MCSIRFWAVAPFLIFLAACDRPTPPAEKVSSGARAEILAADEVPPPPPPGQPPASPDQTRAAQPPASPPPWPARTPTSKPFPRTLPPSPSPFGWSGVVVRLEFDYPAQRIRYLGTGFVVRDRTKADWLITCAHLIGEKAWEERYQVKMRTMKGDRIIRSYGTTLHVGVSVDVGQLSEGRWPDMTQDLVIRSVAGEWVKPLPLARSDPEVGEWVWAVGCEARQPPSDEKLFAGQIVQVADGAYIMRKRLNFDPHGFSGGPVVNVRGEVVGTVLAGGGDLVSGATVSILRQRLRAKGIPVN